MAVSCKKPASCTGSIRSGFGLPYSKSLIASRLGMKPETFSRSVATLREHGIAVNNTNVAFDDRRASEEDICKRCSMVDDYATHKAPTRR